MSEKNSGANIQIIVAIIGATAVCIAAIIGILQPAVSRWVDNNFPTNTPVSAMATSTISSPIVFETAMPIQAPTEMPTFPSPPTPTDTLIAQIPSTLTPDCWQTIWKLNPTSEKDIKLSLSSPRPGYVASFDPAIYADSPGSLRLETNKIVKDFTQDQNSWSWMINIQVIPANNGLYRVTAMMKTQDVYASHISVVARDKNGNDIFQSNTNQIAVVPVGLRALFNTTDWQSYSSGEFNPKEWSNDVMYIAIGINAGWSIEGNPSITWFDNVQIQYCGR